MADNLPVNFPIPGENVLSNYDYMDIAEGTGVVLFYGGEQANDADGTTKALQKNILASNSRSFLVSTAGTYNYNFNLTVFNIPKTIRGTATVQVSAYRGNNGDGLTLTYTFYKVSGATETSFGASTMSFPASANAYSTTFTIPIALTETDFKRGDYLRVLARYVKTNAASTVEVGWDPLNRDGTNLTAASYPTQLKIYVPFKLGLD
jgi:hypothetical protein